MLMTMFSLQVLKGLPLLNISLNHFSTLNTNLATTLKRACHIMLFPDANKNTGKSRTSVAIQTYKSKGGKSGDQHQISCGKRQ